MDDDDALFEQINNLETSMREFNPSNLNKMLLGMGGDDDDDDDMFHEPPFQVGRETILVKRPDEVCLGIVRDTRVCLKERSSCSFKSHDANKFVPPCSGSFFLVKTTEDKKGNYTCASSPLLPADDLSQDLIEHILGLESTDSDFGAIFGLIVNNSITTKDELDGTKNLVRTVRKRVKNVKTPAKMDKQNRLEDTLVKLTNIQDALEDSMESQVTFDMVTKLLELSNDDSALKELVGDILSRHARNIETLHKRVRNALHSVQMHVSFRTRELSEVHNVTEGLQAIVDEIRGSIGKRSAPEAGLADHSLWQQAATMNSRLDKAEKAMGRIVQQVAKVTQQVLSTQSTPRVSSQQPSHDNDNDAVMDEILGGSGNHRQRTSGQYQYGNLGFDGINVSGSNPPSTGPSIQNGYLHPPSHLAGGTGAGGAGGGGSGGGGGGGGRGNNNSSVSFRDDGHGNSSSTSSSLSDLHSLIHDLSQRVSRCEDLKLAGTDVVVIGDHVFRSSYDVHALLEEQMGVGAVIPFSCFTSPNHIMDLMFKVKSPTTPTAKDIKALRDLSLRDQEMKAFQSATHEQPRPNLFAHQGRLQNHTYSTKVSQSTEVRFQPLGTAEDYGILTDTDGLHQALINTLGNVQVNLMNDINRSLRGKPVLLALATQMLNTSVACVTSLLAFLGQTFTQLNKSFEGPTLAWDCVCKSLEDLWDQKFFPTKSEMSSADFSSISSLASLVIWSNLRMVSVASRLSTVTISAHPIVTSSYIRFLIDHLANKKDVAVADVLREVKRLKTELDESKKEMTALKSKVSGLESKTDRVTNQVNNLAKKK